MLTFVKSVWICGYGVPILQDHDWKEKLVTFKEEKLRERYDQHIFASVRFRRMKMARFSVVMLKCEKGGVAVMSFAKVVVLLRASSGRGARRANLRLCSTWRQEHL